MTKHQPGTLEALAEILAQRVNTAQGIRPKMHVVSASRPERIVDAARQETTLWQRRLRVTYRLNGVVSPAVFNIPGVAQLSDTQLIRLLADIEESRQCCVESISYEIIRPQQTHTQELREGFAA